MDKLSAFGKKGDTRALDARLSGLIQGMFVEKLIQL